ncbi:hypothetical protein ENSA5_25960 [Enhygromyxa salina]|uniref:Uncharacterized protein n=1 Tax=Enhygromyxa salina TaxID=215803 RepID=A0A2S9YAK0_9BACT|nr:hypothetical protein [Enhygromyxa salina]PRQ02137.1 hypothetical protein ENSA5_25960 [Enhygromyxa salina]
MDRLSKLGALGGVVLALVSGCVEPYEPNWLYRGEWIDIDGRDRSAEETCEGTFAYVDAYAWALAAEFGVSEHLGSYRWYSHEEYDAELPCDGASACAWVEDRTAHTPLLPHEHEMVHLANTASGMCPSALTEGLAEVYGGYSYDSKTSDFERLVARMEAPSGLSPGDYGILGRFAAYLVERFGLEAVLDVCRITGRYPSGAELSAAMESVVGMTTAELLADFEPELGECNEAERYRWRVFGCGVGEAAPDLGLLSGDGEHRIETTFTLDCANAATIGPLADRIWTAARFDVDASMNYDLWISEEQLVETPGVELKLVKCEPCARPETIPSGFFGTMPLEAGRYSLELHAPADFRAEVTLSIWQ